MTISRAQMASQLTGNKMKKIKKMNRGGSTGDSQMELARRADRKRRYSEDGPKGMSFSEAQTPIRYLASKILGRSERRDFERNQPRIRAEADDLERQVTDSLSRMKKGGKVRGDGICQRGKTKGTMR
jgi:hypothetical protein